MKKKNKFYFSRSIKLGVALGDWTELKSPGGDEESLEVSGVDSTSFDSLSKEDLAQMHHLHQLFATLMSQHLSKDMDIKIELHTIMVTQIMYSDFINSMSDNIFQSDLKLPGVGTVNFIFGANLASMMVNRLVGGSGNKQTHSEFTALERDILNTQIQELLPHFRQVWNGCFDINDASLELYSGSYKEDKRLSYRESTVVFTFYLYFGDGELLRFMVAYSNETIRRLIRAYTTQSRVIKPEIRLKKQTLDSIYYDVKAVLGQTQLPVHVLNTLEVDDVIPLDQSVRSLVSVSIGDSVKLKAQPCVHNNKISCQVVVPQKQRFPITLDYQDVEEKDLELDATESGVSLETVDVAPDINSVQETTEVDDITEVDEKTGDVVPDSDDMVAVVPDDVKDDQNVEIEEDDVEEAVVEQDEVEDEQEAEEDVQEPDEEAGVDDEAFESALEDESFDWDDMDDMDDED